MNYFNKKLIYVSSFVNILNILILGNSVFAGNILGSIENEIHKLIDSSKVSVVTIASRFSQEIYVKKESGILSFFKNEVQKQALSYINIGTGIILDKSGHILTRSSIVWGAESNTVTLANGKEVSADFIGHDPETGFAVIKQSGNENLKPAKLGKMDEINPGSLIVMIGNSLGVFPSIDFGVINGIRNDGIIQISANLIPGNNGSPIFNFSGEVVGLVAGRLNVQNNLPTLINDHQYTETTLAYPINWIKRIAEDIIEFGHIRKGWLGVVGSYDGHQPKIRQIKENSPAKKAGLIEGDVIVKYSNRAVKDMTELVHLVEMTTPGQIVTIEFNRVGQMLQTEIEIGEKIVKNAPDFEYKRTGQIDNTMIGNSGLSVTQQSPTNSFERNQFFLMRINYLEKEIAKLKEMIEN